MSLEVRSISRLFKKLAGYTLVAAAALMAPRAHADSITYVVVDQTVNTSGAYYNFSPSGNSSSEITIQLSLANSLIFAGLPNGSKAKIVTDANGAEALSFGTAINPSATGIWGSGGNLVGYNGILLTGEWPTNGSSDYLGFYFVVGSNKYAGWADIATTSTAFSSSFEVLSYAYENTANTSILAGETTAAPEPSTLALLALGCVGLLEARRRLKNA